MPEPLKRQAPQAGSPVPRTAAGRIVAVRVAAARAVAARIAVARAVAVRVAAAKAAVVRVAAAKAAVVRAEVANARTRIVQATRTNSSKWVAIRVNCPVAAVPVATSPAMRMATRRKGTAKAAVVAVAVVAAEASAIVGQKDNPQKHRRRILRSRNNSPGRLMQRRVCPSKQSRRRLSSNRALRNLRNL